MVIRVEVLSMPAKPHSKKYVNQKKPAVVAPVMKDASETGTGTVATVAKPVVKAAPVPAIQPEKMRHISIRKELVKVFVVTAITTAILVVLWVVMR